VVILELIHAPKPRLFGRGVFIRLKADAVRRSGDS
jgi:hypothetical protein